MFAQDDSFGRLLERSKFLTYGHLLVTMLLLLWSLVPDVMRSFFLPYRFLHPMLPVAAIYFIAGGYSQTLRRDTEGWTYYRNVSLWLLVLSLVLLAFDGFYFGFHMIWRGFVDCSLTTVCNTPDKLTRYIITAVLVGLHILLELAIAVLAVYLRSRKYEYACGPLPAKPTRCPPDSDATCPVPAAPFCPMPSASRLPVATHPIFDTDNKSEETTVPLEDASTTTSTTTTTTMYGGPQLPKMQFALATAIPWDTQVSQQHRRRNHTD